MPTQSGGSLIRDLTDGSTDGTQLGGAASDPVSFFGATPVVQPTDSTQAAITRGSAAGVVTTYYTNTVSPTAVTLNTAAEYNMTALTGTGAQMLLASGDVVIVNKIASQAGLTVGNARVQASGVAGITFGNATGSTITPTASNSYTLVGIRAGSPLVLTAALTPASVAANTTVEQQFAVTGLSVGQLVQVNKPTAQAGLDILGCRIVSKNVLGITFGNFTATAILPTAAESYSIFVSSGLDAVNNDVFYGMNMGSVGAISAGVVITGGSTTLTGVLATDMVTGIFKPTPQATATNIATPIYGIPTADTLTSYFLGTGTGSTPTAAEIYGIRTARLAPKAPLVLYSPSLAPVSVAANTSAEQTFTVTGLVAASPVWINKPSLQPGLGIGGVRVSGVNTLAINFVNLTGTAIVPATETYTIGNFQVPTPGAGNSVYQTVSPTINALSNLSNALRTAAVNTGLIAGA